MDLKKVRLYDQMNKLEGKPVISAYKEKKLKYEISVLKAELLHEKNNKKKLACELEKYKNRYKLNNFHSEALAN